MFKIILILVAIQFCVGQDADLTENCIRCLCHARTGCYELKNCASYSINEQYWVTAGRPTLLDDSPNDADAYRNCIKNDGCIIRTVRGYVSALGRPDCNCDNQIVCKDFFAAHLNGITCAKSIDNNRLRRFDKCAMDRNIANTIGWTVPVSCEPSSTSLPENEIPGPV